MNQSEIARRRLAGQLLARPSPAAPEEVVRSLGAVQAQDYLGVLWAVGARSVGATERTVERALAEARIVRTWPMRGTIHLVPPEDARWMLQLLTPRVNQRGQARLRQLGLDAAVISAGARVIAAALEGGRQLTRPALFGLLEAAGIATGGQRGYHILNQLAHAGLICFGPRAGKQPTFALLDEWLPPAPALSRDEALAALALRYFTGHGPATVHDLAWWSGLTVGDARAGLAAVAGQLEVARADGLAYYYDGSASADPGPEAPVLLLPPFDELLVGYRDRSPTIDPADLRRVAPGANGVFHPIVVHAARVVGTWRRTLRAARVELSFSPFEPWGDELAGAIPAAAERYARFLGLPAAVEAIRQADT